MRNQEAFITHIEKLQKDIIRTETDYMTRVRQTRDLEKLIVESRMIERELKNVFYDAREEAIKYASEHDLFYNTYTNEIERELQHDEERAGV